MMTSHITGIEKDCIGRRLRRTCGYRDTLYGNNDELESLEPGRSGLEEYWE
jgi:hypothetical protein